jgi:hypothetical protein
MAGNGSSRKDFTTPVRASMLFKLLLFGTSCSVSIWLFLYACNLAGSSIDGLDYVGYKSISLFYSEDGETPLILSFPYYASILCFLFSCYVYWSIIKTWRNGP